MTDNKNSLGMDEKTASWFAYVLSIISAIILLATEKDNRTVRLHAWQSLFLGCFMVAVYIVLAIIAAIIGFGLYFSGGFIFFSILYNILWIGWLVLTIICILKATQNDIFKIPVIYNWAEKMK
jgi:uncharacterized membrane protein